MQEEAFCTQPQGLPWDWHLEPRVYPKAHVYSAPVMAPLQADWQPLETRCASLLLASSVAEICLPAA